MAGNQPGALSGLPFRRETCVCFLNYIMYTQVNHEYPVKEGVPYSGIVSSFGSGQEGVKKGVFKQDKRNLSEIGSYRKKAIQILDEVNYDK